MFSSRAEIVGWIVAILIVVGMGIVVFTGPFNNVNKSLSSTKPTPASTGPVVQDQIVNDARDVGKYVPATITVKVGQEIVFSNVSSTPHTVTARDNSFDSKDISTSAKWTLRPSKAGTFKYYCIYHPLMTGVLVVRA